MEQMIDAIQTNPALGLALVLLAFALILSIVKKLVKLAALVLLVLGGLGYFLQSQETTLPEALERANDELRDAADNIGDVSDGMKERLKATQTKRLRRATQSGTESEPPKRCKTGPRLMKSTGRREEAIAKS